MAEQLADEQRHVSLFAYGVGRGVDRAELLHIIGGPPTCTVTLAAAAAATAAAASAGADGGVERPAGGGGVSLSAWGEDPEDRWGAGGRNEQPQGHATTCDWYSSSLLL